MMMRRSVSEGGIVVVVVLVVVVSVSVLCSRERGFTHIVHARVHTFNARGFMVVTCR